MRRIELRERSIKAWQLILQFGPVGPLFSRICEVKTPKSNFVFILSLGKPNGKKHVLCFLIVVSEENFFILDFEPE
jgi:hypothetical protein